MYTLLIKTMIQSSFQPQSGSEIFPINPDQNFWTQRGLNIFKITHTIQNCPSSTNTEERMWGTQSQAYAQAFPLRTTCMLCGPVCLCRGYVKTFPHDFVCCSPHMEANTSYSFLPNALEKNILMSWNLKDGLCITQYRNVLLDQLGENVCQQNWMNLFIQLSYSAQKQRCIKMFEHAHGPVSFLAPCLC